MAFDCKLFLLVYLLIFAGVAAPAAPGCTAQAPAPQTQPAGPLDRLKAMMGEGKSAWTAEQIATMVRLRDAAMSDSYALNELRHLTDNIGPRLSGSPQAQQAVEYVAAEMRALGAKVTLERAAVPHWVRGAETAEVVHWPGQTPGTTQKIVLTALGPSVATPPEGITAEVAVVADWKQLRALPPDSIKGKILLFNHKFDKELAAEGQGLEAYVDDVVYRANGPSAGGALGAAAVLVRSVGGADYRLPHAGETEYSPGVQRLPAAAVTAEDADLLSDLAAQGPVTLHLTLTPRTFPDVESDNVIADWPGTEHPEQVVVVSGHLDSWDLGTGAIDDGAGVVVSMETIHLMGQLGIHPRRTIRMIAWMSEEEGSQGATAYMAEHGSEMADHVGAIESDLGADHPTGIYYAGKAALGPWL
jgi:carboxypeptidase Q